jgi:mono/diheme cytochrome c family protein
MIPCKPIRQRLILTVLLLCSLSVIKIQAQDASGGRTIFQSKCGSCHKVVGNSTGPQLGGVLDGEFYAGDIKKVLHWAYNVPDLVKSDPHYQALKAQFGSDMLQFNPSSLTEADAKSIFAYMIKNSKHRHGQWYRMKMHPQFQSKCCVFGSYH